MQFQPLIRAIAKQYEVFASARPRRVEGCECCTTPRELAELVAAPRERLTATVLDFYAQKALTTVGHQIEFRYFWPRLAELAIAGDFTTDREVVFGKPHYGESDAWPAAEQAALIELASALGQWLGAKRLENTEVDEWVCSIGLLAEGLADVRPFLSPLLDSSEIASANLAGFIDWNRSSIEQEKRLTNAFWSSAPHSAAGLLEWYREEPRVREAIYEIDVRSAELYGTPLPARPPHTGS